MKKRKILWGLVSCLMALTMVMAACTPKPTPPTPPTAPQTGVVEVRAMDAPPKGVSKIMVTTSNIEVHKAGASEASWVSVIKEAKTFDLVTIQGAEMLLGQKELEAGQYTQIRLDVTGVKVVLEGKELVAKLPGEKLKVVGNWEVKAGQKTILTLDFDADKFVVITGNDQAQVKPVIKLLVSQGERPLTKPAPDKTPPTVSLTINANGATNVAVNTKTGAFFSERMDPSTINNTTFTLKQGTTPVTGTVTYAGVAVLFTPAANLAANTEYTATITTGAKDLAGNALANPYTWRWTTAASADTTAPVVSLPVVSSTINANGSTDVPVNTKVGASFSDVMDPLTFTTTTFTLTQGTTPVIGEVTYVGLAATFTPAEYLATNKEYTATITTGVKDLAGNSLANPYVWSFTTGAALDATAPLVSSTVPPNVDTGVPINSAISATFSETMDPLTVTTATFTLMRGNTLIAGAVSYTGVTAIFTPSETLANYTVYTATITTGAKDLAGNALAANKVWTFTTTSGTGGGGGGGGGGDTTAPVVSSTIPANAATGVSINSAISATFSEAMIAGTVTTATFTLLRGSTPVDGTVAYTGVTATFLPDALPLTASSNYTATITTAVTDLAGNHLAANKVWSFTTGVAPDTTAPIVSSTIPANTADNVSINSAISATFSEAMITGTVTNVAFTLMRGTTSVEGTVNYAGITATFLPDVLPLTASSNYTATITTAVTDLAGNHLAANKVWTFTTGVAPDTTAPTVSSTIPDNAAIGVGVNSNISAAFNEAMIAGLFTPATFTLIKQGGTSVNGTVDYAGFTATFNPDGNLAASSNYTATITTAVTDLAGNNLVANKVWTFTTGVILASNPTAPIASSGLAAGTVLGEASGFVIIGHAAVTANPPTATSVSNGDMGLIGHARSVYAGFTQTLNPRQFTELTNGLFYANDDDGLGMPIPTGYASSTAFLVQVQTDLGEAYTFLQGVNPTFPVPIDLSPDTELGLKTLTRGVYNTGASVTISTGDLHLDAQGDPDSIWIFQIGTDFTTTSPGLKIWLDNGAQAQNVYWVVSGTTSIGAGMEFNGNVFSGANIAIGAGGTASLLGRFFAMTEGVTTISNTITGFNPGP